MSATFTITGSDKGALKIIDQITKALLASDKAADNAAKSAKRFDDSLSKQAQRIKESIDPQEKLNRLYRELGVLVNANKLTIDQATAAGVKYRQELMGAAKEGEKAFGGNMLGNATALVAGYLSLSSAIGTVTGAMRDQASERKRAADESFRARAGLGSLSQLAATAADPKQELRRLFTEARAAQGTGAATDENEAGALLFELVSAGLERPDRDFAFQLRAKGTLQNIGGAAKSFDALKTALGAGETGNFQQFMSKALQAAAVAPGSFEQLPIAAAGAGGSAKQLGVSDDFLLAATAIVGKTLGSVDEGGTQVAAFLKQAEKAGGFGGLGGIGIVEKLAGMSEAKQGFGGVLGDRSEAIAGYRVLRDNLPALRALQQQVGAAESSNLAGLAIGLNEVDPRQSSANARAAAEGSLAQSQGAAYAQRENLIATIRAERRKMFTEKGRTVSLAGDYIASGIGDAFGSDADIRGVIGQSQTERTLGAPQTYSAGTISKAEEYLRRAAESNERLERQQRSRVTTRPE